MSVFELMRLDEKNRKPISWRRALLGAAMIVWFLVFCVGFCWMIKIA